MMLYTTVFLLLLVVGLISTESCVGRCGLPPDSNHQCQCNTVCKTYNDCCDDYDAFCLGATCSGRCGDLVDSSKPCQCNTPCVSYNDCCPDYQSLCNGGGGSTPGCDMSCFAQQLWDSDVNKVSLLDMIHNYQGQTTSSGTSDLAPNKLFTYINENHFNTKPTFQKFIALLDNYNRNIGQTEELTPSEWTEIEDFLSTVLQTQVMKLTYDYLLNNGHVTGEANFKDVLRELWFNLYPRSSSSGTAIDSSGFEHAMVGETRGTVSGFHSWIQFYLEEKKGHLDYQGWVSKAEPEIMGAKFTWYGQMKTKGSFFMRVSPEFDLALYSVCALTKPSAICSFTMAGHSIRIQTWDVAHKTGSQIGSAYPAI